MLISFGYDISLRLEVETAVLFCLRIHPSRRKDLVSGENFQINPQRPFEEIHGRIRKRGYLGDIGIPPAPDSMDFSAWMEVYLGGRWYAFDPRHNRRRIGRIVVARGRDASDVALTTVFGKHQLAEFSVVTEEVSENRVLLAPANSKGNGSSPGNRDKFLTSAGATR